MTFSNPLHGAPANDLVELQLEPRRLSGQGELVLHAALVAGPSCAIALTGPSGVGKSTLSASLREAGWRLIGDDTMQIEIEDAAPSARAVFPRLRLRPGIADALGISGLEDEGVDYLGKRVFHLVADTTATRLSAVFVLGAETAEGGGRTNRLQPAEACMAIVRNSFAADPEDPHEAAQRLGLAARVASAIPVIELRYPRRIEALPAVHAMISAEARKLPSAVGT